MPKSWKCPVCGRQNNVDLVVSCMCEPEMHNQAMDIKHREDEVCIARQKSHEEWIQQEYGTRIRIANVVYPIIMLIMIVTIIATYGKLLGFWDLSFITGIKQ